MAIEKIYNYKLEGNQYNVTIVSNNEVSQKELQEIKKVIKVHYNLNFMVEMNDYYYEKLANKNISIYNVSFTKYMLTMCEAKIFVRLAYFN